MKIQHNFNRQVFHYYNNEKNLYKILTRNITGLDPSIYLMENIFGNLPKVTKELYEENKYVKVLVYTTSHSPSFNGVYILKYLPCKEGEIPNYFWKLEECNTLQAALR